MHDKSSAQVTHTETLKRKMHKAHGALFHCHVTWQLQQPSCDSVNWLTQKPHAVALVDHFARSLTKLQCASNPSLAVVKEHTLLQDMKPMWTNTPMKCGPMPVDTSTRFTDKLSVQLTEHQVLQAPVENMGRLKGTSPISTATAQENMGSLKT